MREPERFKVVEVVLPTQPRGRETARAQSRTYTLRWRVCPAAAAAGPTAASR